MGEKYPFYTEEIQGEKKVGIMFNPHSGNFYEFVDPEKHDCHEKLKCPRTGETIEFENGMDRLKAEALFGHTRALIQAEKWKEFRETYVQADEENIDQFKEDIKRMLTMGD